MKVDRFGRFQLALVAAALLGAIATFVVGAPENGVLLLSGSDDNALGHVLQLNGTGAVVYLIAGLVAGAGVVLGQRLVVLAAAAVWAALAVQVVIWFPTWTSADNPLGTNRGSNIAFCALMALGLWAADWGRRQTSSSASAGHASAGPT